MKSDRDNLFQKVAILLFIRMLVCYCLKLIFNKPKLIVPTFQHARDRPTTASKLRKLCPE